MKVSRGALASILALIAGCDSGPPPSAAADAIYLDGYVYTVDPARSVAEAVAIKDGEIVFVGTSKEARRLAGERTRVVDLGGRMMIPGLNDVHIHPLEIVSPGGCDLDNRPQPLSELVITLKACLERAPPLPGEWLIVRQWNPSTGNEPGEDYPTLRAALDAVSREHPVLLLGSDGHHGAGNSAALARARDGNGDEIGFDKRSLGAELSVYRPYVGVDAGGEPNGVINEGAREVLGLPETVFWSLPEPDAMRAMAAKLASYGITSVLDAATSPAALELYRQFAARGDQTFRLTAALYPDLEIYRGEGGRVDVVALVAALAALRAEYGGHPLIAADAAKIFIDGVVEGDPYSDPPVLPNAAMLAPYKQPLFAFDGQELAVRGYVKFDSELCQAVRALPERFGSHAGRQAFRASHGYAPSQCEPSNGVLEHPLEFINDYIRELDANDFTVHAHAIGDRAVRVAVDAFERARAANGERARRHAIAHAQLVHPDDVPRIGRLGLCLAFTYAWMEPVRPYDLTVVPFIDEIDGVGDLYNPDHYSYRNSYPVRSLGEAGALLCAGSDAPVDTREPRPFVNIEKAVTRANADGQVWNPEQTIDIRAALAAYTINGARHLGREDLTGSIEVGKRADLAVLDRNPIELYEAGRAHEIGQTRVMTTIFDGREVFNRE